MPKFVGVKVTLALTKYMPLTAAVAFTQLFASFATVSPEAGATLGVSELTASALVPGQVRITTALLPLAMVVFSGSTVYAATTSS